MKSSRSIAPFAARMQIHAGLAELIVKDNRVHRLFPADSIQVHARITVNLPAFAPANNAAKPGRSSVVLSPVIASS